MGKHYHPQVFFEERKNIIKEKTICSLMMNQNFLLVSLLSLMQRLLINTLGERYYTGQPQTRDPDEAD